MIRINLLPIRTQLKKERSKHFVITYLLSVTLALVIIGYVWNWQNRVYEKVSRNNARLRDDLNRYAKYDLMLKRLKKEKSIIDEKSGIIRSLQKDRDKMARTLALFSIFVPPEKMWFLKFSDSMGRVTLNGVALSDEAIAEFLRNLETSPYVARSSVNLSHSRLKVVGDKRLREFQVSCRVLPYSQVRRKLKPAEKKSMGDQGKAGT